MKSFRFFLLGVLVMVTMAADFRISNLPAKSSVSTNTFIEVADMDAVTKSGKYLLTNLATVTYVNSRPIGSTNWVDVAAGGATLAGTATAAAYTVGSTGAVNTLQFMSLSAGPPFAFTSAGSDFSGVTDDTLYWGYNYGQGGAKFNTNYHAFGFNLEADYFTGGKHYSEWNIGLNTTNSVARRYLDFQVDKDDPDSHAFWSFALGGDGYFRLVDLLRGTTLMQINTNGFMSVGPNVGAASDVLEVKGSGNMGVLVNNTGNGGGDYSVVRLTQNSATKGQFYTHSDNFTIQAVSGQMDLVASTKFTLNHSAEVTGDVKATGVFYSGGIAGITTTWTNMIPGVITQRISTVGGVVVTNLTL